MKFSKNTTSDNYDELTFSEIHTNATEAYVNLKLTNYIKSSIREKIDTGAQGNILHLRILKQIHNRRYNQEHLN